MRNGSVSESDIILQGSATVDEDYTFDGIDDDGIHFTILEDDEWEYDETVVIRIPSSGNATHTLILIHLEETGVQLNIIAVLVSLPVAAILVLMPLPCRGIQNTQINLKLLIFMVLLHYTLM